MHDVENEDIAQVLLHFESGIPGTFENLRLGVEPPDADCLLRKVDRRSVVMGNTMSGIEADRDRSYEPRINHTRLIK